LLGDNEKEFYRLVIAGLGPGEKLLCDQDLIQKEIALRASVEIIP
jgi:hypothetical protein